MPDEGGQSERICSNDYKCKLKQYPIKVKLNPSNQHKTLQLSPSSIRINQMHGHNKMLAHALVVTSISFSIGCTPNRTTNPVATKLEVPASKAEVGDVLVNTQSTEVILTSAFKPGQPNGLYDGGVKAITKTGETFQYEVNAVCSMPGLPGWPDYDNIYGKTIANAEEAGKEGGNTQWQLLLRFNGEVISKGKENAPSWAQRLAQNLCRKGDFDDKNIEASTS